MPDPFPLHTPDTAPEASRPFLLAAKEDFGMIPNLEAVMASAPPLLEGYVTLWEAFKRTGLSAVEQQVVYQTANFENGCGYCVPWHSVARRARRGWTPRRWRRCGRGRRSTTTSWRRCTASRRRCCGPAGNPAPADLDAFLAAGHTRENALEVVLGLAVKTMSNFTNGMAQTPLDAAVKKRAWQKPGLRDIAD